MATTRHKATQHKEQGRKIGADGPGASEAHLTSSSSCCTSRAWTSASRFFSRRLSISPSHSLWKGPGQRRGTDVPSCKMKAKHSRSSVQRPLHVGRV